jgi:hypothetical protein
MEAATASPMTPISAEAQSLLDTLSDNGVEVTRMETHEDGLGTSVFWTYHGLRHASGGSTVEEALAYVVFHVGQAA